MDESARNRETVLSHSGLPTSTDGMLELRDYAGPRHAPDITAPRHGKGVNGRVVRARDAGLCAGIAGAAARCSGSRARGRRHPLCRWICTDRVPCLERSARTWLGRSCGMASRTPCRAVIAGDGDLRRSPRPAGRHGRGRRRLGPATRARGTPLALRSRGLGSAWAHAGLVAAALQEPIPAAAAGMQNRRRLTAFRLPLVSTSGNEADRAPVHGFPVRTDRCCQSSA